jgi:hypothetical protein
LEAKQMRIRQGVLLALVLSGAAAAPVDAQDRSWQNKWYWGAQGGTYLFTAGGATQTGFTAGGHWFITAGRSGLYLAYDQILFDQINNHVISTGQQINFGTAQRFQATIYAVPTDSKLQVILGGGFSIQRITDAELVSPPTDANLLALDDAATKAFLVLSGGIQYRFHPRWGLYGQYQYQPASSEFVITSEHHTINLGIRYVLTHSDEAVSTAR